MADGLGAAGRDLVEPLPGGRVDQVDHGADGPGRRILRSLRAGDLTQRLNLSQGDEVGQLTQAIDHAAAAFGKVVKDIRDKSQGVDGSATELSSVSHQMLAQEARR